jgi:hypothetical protein
VCVRLESSSNVGRTLNSIDRTQEFTVPGCMLRDTHDEHVKSNYSDFVGISASQAQIRAEMQCLLHVLYIALLIPTNSPAFAAMGDLKGDNDRLDIWIVSHSHDDVGKYTRAVANA